MPAPFRFDRSFDLDATPAELWRALAATDRYPEWWSWLRVLEGAELREGTVAQCVVRAPIPYTLEFEVAVQRVVPHEVIDTHVHGDLEGPARLEISPRPQGCAARLAWTLEMRDALLRPFSVLARPVLMWAHDRLIATGLRDFERRALNGTAPDETAT